MKQITFRELLNLIHEGKAPKQVKYEGKLYQKYENFDYSDKSRLLSSVMGEHHTLEFMALNKAITIYDEILDEKEKEYISNVIKPFKKCISLIKKIPFYGEQEKIIILDKNELSFIVFPNFKEGTMYKGMELYKGYTVEELGL